MYIIKEDNSIEMVRGDSADFDIYLPIKDEEGQIIGEYTLEEGDVLLFTVKKNTKTDEVIFQKSGQHVEILPEDTETLPYGKYVYDVELTYASGFRDTVIRPKELKLTDEVTFPHEL